MQPDEGRYGRREANKPNPLQTRAQMVADMMFERAWRIVELITEDVPLDAEELTPQETWLLLEGTALELPNFWMWPSEALNELIKLREQFAPGRLDTEEARIIAEFQAKQEKALPDPTMSPAAPGWDKYARRLGIREEY